MRIASLMLWMLVVVSAGTVAAKKPLDEARVEAGLRETLAIAGERSIETLSTEDGVWGDPLYRLPIPEELSGLVTALTAKGIGERVEAFEVSINRVAEQLIGGSGRSVSRQLDKLEFEDANAVLERGDTAATLYFNAAAYDTIRAEMLKRAPSQMEQERIYQQLATLLTKYTKVAAVKRPTVEINTYVVDGAMQALFGQMAQEERRIREDPDARPTKTLRRLFRQSYR